MKTLTTKKIVFWLGALSLLGIVAILFVDSYYGSMCRYYDNSGHTVKFCETAVSMLFSVVVLFLLNLITYKMRDEVFRAWWNFARWWVFVIIYVIYFLSTQSGGGGLGISMGAFDAVFLGFFYAVLIIVSLWRIVRKYRQLNREPKRG